MPKRDDIAQKPAQKRQIIRQSMDMDVDGILGRIKEVANVKTDKEVAAVLLMKPQSLSTARERGKLPLDALGIYCTKHNVGFEWLMTGEMPELPRALQGIKEDSAYYVAIKTMRKVPLIKMKLVMDLLKELAEEGDDEKA